MATEGQRGRGQGPQQGQGKWEGGRKWQQEGEQSWVTGKTETGGEEARPGRWSEGGQVWEERRREVTGEQGAEGGQESLGLAGKGRDRCGDLSSIP